jgi:hypothetical protein
VLSLNFRKALFSQESGEVPDFPVDDHASEPGGADPAVDRSDARISTDPLVYGTVSRGNRRSIMPASSLTLPDEQDRSPPAQS